MAFAAMLLASVLFLTGIWHEPIITAGLMIFPGPAMAAATAVPGARLGSRFGPDASAPSAPCCSRSAASGGSRT